MNAGAYLQGQDPTTPSASPLFADLTGLPPTLILAGTNDALLDDSTRLADRARQAGVAVTAERRRRDVPHVADDVAFLPEARAAVQEIGEFVRDRT